jgi:hypothetical protein
MEQLINMIAERTGISVEQAREATNMVVGFLKERLPEPIAAQVESVLSNQSFGDLADQAQKRLGGLGDLFG